MLTHDDCRRCGACCCNTAANRAEGFRRYIEVGTDDRELRRRSVDGDKGRSRGRFARYLEVQPDGSVFLRLLGEEHRCAALRGAIGRSVFCEIYSLRPQPCRRVQPGDADCLARRTEWGL